MQSKIPGPNGRRSSARPGAERKRAGANGSVPNGASARNGHGSGERPAVITGGAGFIGTNLAHRLLKAGHSVVVYDNLSRPGVAHNLEWLRETHGSRVRLEQADIRDFATLRRVVSRASQVYHFAAQVAVTTSLDRPFEDFEINARGTLNLLEALRSLPAPPPLLFTSTNKVYGDLQDVRLRVRQDRYEPVEEEARAHGFSEQRALHFHSPYGCSKGAACQYVQDYARTFGLRTAVFRMSCIYGPHQFGNEDQGWVAHFLIRTIENSPLTIYGDGRQVRDVLYVEDLVEAMLLAQEHIDDLAGEVFNIGGGPNNTISLLELLEMISQLHGERPGARFHDWRPADQLYYVSDTRKFTTATGWTPKVDVRAGVAKLYHWLREFHPAARARLAALPVRALRRNGEVTRVSTAAIRPKTIRSRRAIKLKAERLAQGNGNRWSEDKLAKPA